MVGQQLLLMGALPRLSAAACIYVALNEQVEGRGLGYVRQGKGLLLGSTFINKEIEKNLKQLNV